MTTPTSSAAQCDRIISMIDECLAEVGSGLRIIAGEGRSSPNRVPSRHLAVIKR